MDEPQRDPRLLHPPNATAREEHSLPEETAEDLQLRVLSETMGRNGEERHIIRSILGTLTVSAETIRYRQEVFRDMLQNPRVVQELEELMPRIEELVNFRGVRRSEGLPFLESVWRLGELELYVEIMDRLSEILAEPEQPFTSRGLTELRRRVEQKRGENTYRSLKKELPRLSAGIRQKSSITLGINLDSYLRPVEAGIVSINAETYRRGHFLSRVMGNGGSFTTAAPIHSSPSSDGMGKKLPLAPLFQDLETLVRSSARKLLGPLQNYLHLHTGFLDALRTDVIFFLGGVRLYRTFREAGLPVAIPEILPPEQRELHARRFYNPLLHLENGSGEPGEAQQIVTSNVDFDEHGRIFVLTGPNRGGKTTFTSGIGLCHLMAQAGLFVPSEQCSLSPVEQICTHYPRREEEQTHTGRLGEEARRLYRLFEELTPRSLVLLNESLTSTSPGEGVYLARDVLRALRLAGVRAIFTTHFHDLALAAEEINRETEGSSPVASLVAEAEREKQVDDDSSAGGVRRTYRIVRRSPDGSSHARDIAYRHGISFGQLQETLRRRGLL
jgi:hypothetical protein